MKQSMTLFRCLAFVAVGGLSFTAHAQIGSGWTEYFPTKSIQLWGPTRDVRGGTSYSNSGGVETFTMTDNDERAEAKVNNNYSSGMQQFQGELKANYGQGTSMHQVFKFVMVVYYPDNGGELRQHSGTHMISGIKGVWVRVNTIHNVAAGYCDVYINGTYETRVNQGAGPWYHKYGVYNASTEGAQSQWRNVRYFKDGSASGFSGNYRIVARHSGKAVVVQSASLADGANVFQYTYTSATPRNDEWEIISVGSGFYRIMNRHSGKALVVQSASTADGADVIQWTYGGSNTNDEWSIVDLGGGYYRIVNRNSGKVLNVSGSGTSDGTNIDQWSWTGGSNQQFQLIQL